MVCSTNQSKVFQHYINISKWWSRSLGALYNSS